MHIFEDYRKDWIDTLDTLYSDFEDIKQSGDQEKILAISDEIILMENGKIKKVGSKKEVMDGLNSKQCCKVGDMNE